MCAVTLTKSEMGFFSLEQRFEVDGVRSQWAGQEAHQKEARKGQTACALREQGVQPVSRLDGVQGVEGAGHEAQAGEVRWPQCPESMESFRQL